MKFLDQLKQPINLGDKLLIKGYYAMSLDTIATVVAINAKSVSVEFQSKVIDQRSIFDPSTGKWTPPTYRTETVKMTRRPSECLKITNEFIANAQQEAEQAMQEFLESKPEDHFPTTKITATRFKSFLDTIRHKSYDYKSSYHDKNEELDAKIDQKVAEIANAWSKKHPEYAI